MKRAPLTLPTHPTVSYMNDVSSSQLPDQQARNSALDIGQSFIVQAPAGSGKTELLTMRYLKLLAMSSQPEEVLAITFTKKAASEMRDRIIRILSWCRTCDDACNQLSGIEAARLKIGRSVLERNNRQNWRLLESPGRLRVQTIDSFCLYLAKQLPTLSQIGGNPNVTEDIDICCKEAVHATVSHLESDTQLAHHIGIVLTHLDNDLASVENQLLQMLKQRDQWSNYITDLTANNNETVRFLKSGLSELIRETLLSVTSALKHSEDKLVELANFAASNLDDEEQRLSLAKFFPLKCLPNSEMEALPAWLFLLSFLLKKQKSDAPDTAEWLRQVTKNHGFPTKIDGSRESQTACKAYKCKRDAVIETLQRNPDVLQQLAFIRMLPTAEEENEQWVFVTSLCHVLRALNAELLLAFTRHRVVDYTQTGAAANLALGAEDEPTDLALALDNSINHILVDEFQDTSQLQLNLLRKLTAGWLPGDGRTLFLVGDAMQSCYSFRNANVGIYLDAQIRGIGEIRLKTLILKSNFRSQQPVIDWVNDIFADAFPAQADISRGAVPFSRAEVIHKKSDGEGVAVNLITTEKGQRLEALLKESEQLADTVINLRERYPRDSIAILVRTRTQLKNIIPALRARNLSWRANDIDRLAGLPVIEDLLSLVRVILNPGDNFSWLCLLRAPWCGLASGDLLKLSQHSRASNLWLSIIDYESINNLSAQALQTLPLFVPAMQFAIASRYKRSLRQSVEAAWGLLHGINCCRTELEVNCVERFFTLLSEQEVAGGLDDIFVFEKKVGSTFIPSPETGSQPDKLELLTMHKSKGLEFDHVLLPGLSQSTKHDDKDLLVWHERLNAEGNPRFFLAAVTATGLEESSLYKLIRHEKKVRQKLESARLLYIAITRAKKSATLFACLSRGEDGEFSTPPAGSLLALVWPQLRRQICCTAQTSSDPSDRPPANPSSLQSPKQATKISRLNPNLGFTDEEQKRMTALTVDNENRWQTGDTSSEDCPEHAIPATHAERVASKIGTLIHKVFETYTRSNSKPDYLAKFEKVIAFWELNLRPLQLPSMERKRILNHMKATVLKTLSDPKINWIFDNEHREGACELRISRQQNGYTQQFVIDRTFVDQDDTRWIIDYKTSQQQPEQTESEFIQSQTEKYRSQLENYRDLMKATENRTTRLALLLTDIPAVVEIEPN